MKRGFIIILSILIVLSLVFSMYLSMRIMKSSNNTTNVTASPTPMLITENIPTKVNTIDIEYGDGEYEMISNENGPILSKKEIDNIEIKTRNLFRNFEFSEGCSLIKETIDKYNLEEDNVLEKLYYDASIIQSLPYVGFDNITTVSNSIKDPEMLVLGMLYAPPHLRAALIEDKESVMFLYEKDDMPRIYNSNSENEDILNQAKKIHPNIKKMYKFEVITSLDTVYVYVSEYENNISLYSVFMADKDTYSNPELTVKKYTELYNKYQN